MREQHPRGITAAGIMRARLIETRQVISTGDGLAAQRNRIVRHRLIRFTHCDSGLFTRHMKIFGWSR